MVDLIGNDLCNMLYATDINTDGNKLDSKNDGFWFRSVNINLKQHGVGQKMMTG